MRTVRVLMLLTVLALVATCRAEETKKYRLLTRADFDGLVCAVLLRQIGVVDTIEFVHPNDLQEGRVRVNDRDLLANVPYVEGCAMTFDHHASEQVRFKGKVPPNFILDLKALSAAHLVLDFYGGQKRFPNVGAEMMDAVDKANRAAFTVEEILRPKGWALLAFVLDPRTGLERGGGFKTGMKDMVRQLVAFAPGHSIEQMMQLPPMKERTDRYFAEVARCIEQIKQLAVVHGNVVVLDLRKAVTIKSGNRFLIYALHPACNVSIHVMWGAGKKNTVLALGKSIVNRTCRTDLSTLALAHRGGGHVNASSCQVDNAQADRILAELVSALRTVPAPRPSGSPGAGPVPGR